MKQQQGVIHQLSEVYRNRGQIVVIYNSELRLLVTTLRMNGRKCCLVAEARTSDSPNISNLTVEWLEKPAQHKPVPAHISNLVLNYCQRRHYYHSRPPICCLNGLLLTSFTVTFLSLENFKFDNNYLKDSMGLNYLP